MDCFRKVFRAASIKKARLYMAACGLYEAAINGQRVGDFVRAPALRTTASGYSTRPMT